MNKAQLVDQVAQMANMTKSQSEIFIDATLKVIQKTVAKGEEVKLVGFGTFISTTRKTRNGRNPRTGELVQIPGGKVPRFRPGKEFKQLLS